MHFYADCDIYGLKEVSIINYKYRNNFNKELMKLFQKFILERTISGKKTFSTPFNLVNLKKNRPDLFSEIEKNSTCYLEIDTHYTNILRESTYCEDLII